MSKKQNYQLTLEFLGDIKDLQSKIGSLGSSLDKLGASGNSKLQKQFDSLTSAIQKVQESASKPIGSSADLAKVQKDLASVQGGYESLLGAVQKLQKGTRAQKLELLSGEDSANIQKAEKAIADYQKEVQSASANVKQLAKLQEKLAEQQGIKSSTTSALKKYRAELKTTQEELKKLTDQKDILEADLDTAKKAQRSAQGKFTQATKTGDPEAIKKASEALDAAKAKTAQLQEQFNQVSAKTNTASAAVQNLEAKIQDVSTASGTAKNMIKQIEGEIKKIDEGNIAKVEAAFNRLKTAAASIDGIDVVDIKDVSDLDTLLQRLNNLSEQGIQKADAALEKFATEIKGLAPGLRKASEEMDRNARAFEDFSKAAKEVEGLKSRVEHFFSLTNSIVLFRNAVKKAIETVKELDAVMTETAVVTDFSVGDMWDKLPEYTQQATALGAATKDLYAATTLYYQQGLKTEAAMGVGIETMKMARIANMNASDATQAMTAALRGFNMEVNEMNAQKVNDVYSELAAITAADTSQIATAMSKTASIAKSANMEFQTTAAFLAQIIETTQEAPETAGTALKTIIARFAEVKKLKEEGLSQGEDSEGEIIDVNKIQGALRTVGISMDQFFAGTEGLDEVLMKLASKWDSLDFKTQHYIATMAAGSRQQSRFIAMMSDYERTMELVNAAETSAGASNKQFDKTLDSLEAKTQQLKNAWGEFLMGIANSEVIKGVVDLLTQLLQGVNSLSSALSGQSGLGKGVLNLVMALTGLKAGSAIFSGFLSAIGSAFRGGGESSGKAFMQGFAKEFDGTGKVIKGSLNKIKKDLSGWKDAGKIEMSVGGWQRYEQALTTAQSKLKIAEMAEQSLAKAQEAGVGVTIKKNVALKAEWQAAEAVKQASIGLAQATGLSNAAAQDAVLLNAQGIPLEHAVAVAKDGTTAATLREAAVAALGAEATEEEIEAKMKAMAMEKYYASVRQSSILLRLEEIVMTKMGTVSVIAKAAADKLETMGLQKKTAAMLVSLGVIGLIIAAVGILIFAIVKLVQHMKDNTPEAKLKKLQEAAETAGEAAENAAESYNQLKDSLTSIEEGQTALENMTQGTQEWKDKVQELNEQILDLIELYPALAGFVFSENGVLKLDYGKTVNGQTVESILNNERRDVLLAQNAAYAASAKANNYEANKYYDDLNANYGTPEFGGAIVAHKKFGNDIIKSEIATEISDELSKLIASGQIRTKEEARDWVDKNAVVPEGFTTVSAAIYNDRDFERMRIHGRKLIENEGKNSVYNQAIGNNILELAGLGQSNASDIIRGMDESIIKSNYDKAYETAYNSYADQVTKIGVSEAMKLRYAEINSYDYDAASGKFYSGIGADRKEVEGVTTEVIRSGLAAADASNSYASNLTNLESILIKKSDSQKEVLSSVLGNEGQGMTMDMIKKYATYDQETGTFSVAEENYEKIAADAGYYAKNGKSALQAMAEDFGLTVDEMVKTIGDNFQSGGDFLLKKRKNLVAKMTKFSKENKSFEKSAETLAQLEAKFGDWIVEALGGALSSLEMSGSDSLISTGYTMLENVALTGSKEDVLEITNLINNVDWSNPITAAHRLNQELQDGSALTKQYAKNMLDIEKTYFGAANQAKYFFESSDYSEMKEGLGEILDANNEIAASDVSGLADQYGLLNKFMKNTGLSASAVAKLLTSIGKKKINIDHLTDAVLASMTEFGSLETMTENLLDTLSNFDAGPDENEVAGYMKQFSDTVNGNLSKGAVGNSQNFAILDLLFGPDWKKDLEGDELVARMNQLGKILEKNSEDLRASWADLANGKDVYGKDVTYEDYTGKLPTVSDLGSEIQISGFEGMSTKETTGWFMDAYNVSKTYAEMMLADFKNYSVDLATELQANDFAEGMEKLYDNLHTVERKDTIRTRSPVAMQTADGEELPAPGRTTKTVTNTYALIDKTEIAALKEYWGKSRDEVLNALQTQGKIYITDFYDEEGILKETDELLAEVSKIYQKTGQQFKDSFSSITSKYVGNSQGGYEVKIGHVDTTALNEALSNVGIPPEGQARVTQDIVDSMFAAGAKTVDVEAKLSEGTVKTISLQAGESVETAIANAEIDLQNEKLASAIAAAFTDTKVSVETDSASLGQVTEDVTGAVDAAETDIDPAATAESLAQITTDVTTAVQEADTEIDVTAQAGEVTKAINDAVAASDKSISIKASMSPFELNVSGSASGTITISAAAKGLKDAPGGPVLVSEEGPELIQTADGAYMTGLNGPEIVNLNRGDTVYTAEQTKQILKGSSHSMMPRFKDGTASGYKESWGYSGGRNTSSGDDEENKWENSYDKLYNLLRDIDEEMRRRQRIEREYEKILKDINTSAKDLLEVSRKELSQLSKEKGLEQERIAGRETQIQRYQQENSNLTQYGYSTRDEEGRLVFRINWDAINAITDEELGEAVEIYISQMEEWFGDIDEAYDAIDEIDDTAEEILERGKDQYFELENRIKDALVGQYEREIDELANINDAISEADADLVAAIQESVNEQRRQRDNQQAEELLEDKRKRLAYLLQDTSGAHDLEIMELQKEISEDEQDFIDSMVDQKIEELQKQNDMAAEQRERQIELAQNQLGHYIKTGAIWNQVHQLMEQGIDENGVIIDGSALMNLLKNEEEYIGLSELQQLEWGTTLRDQVAEALTWLGLNETGESWDSDAGDNSYSGNNSHTGNYSDGGGGYTPTNNTPVTTTTSKNNPYGKTSGYSENAGPGNTAKGTGAYGSAQFVKSIQWALQDMGYSLAPYGIDGKYGSVTKAAVAAFQRDQGITADGHVGPDTKAQFKLRGYDQGGLADFTGPAWLDGTKARPEYVLNADQTRGFLTFVNILDSLISDGSFTAPQNSGDSSYDIDINVESIGSDYDVEQLAAKIKKMINSEARYRNNNAISLKR